MQRERERPDDGCAVLTVGDEPSEGGGHGHGGAESLFVQEQEQQANSKGFTVAASETAPRPRMSYER